ncbi:MAG: ferredoxin [Spirochaetota bacterium]
MGYCLTKGDAMANRNEKTPGNTPGRYYVDTTCTGCGVCIDTAPGVFVMHDSVAYVVKQPDASSETAAADAKASCPSESIGDDGV